MDKFWSWESWKSSQDVNQEAEVVPAADDVLAGQIGGNDIDQTENAVVAMVGKVSEEEVVKKLDQFQSEFMDLSNEFYKQKWLNWY